MSDVRKELAEALDDAGMAWLEANDIGGDTLGWADIPMEVFADACLTYLSARHSIRLNLLSDGEGRK